MNNTKNIFLISIIIISFLRSDLASPEPFMVQQPNGEMISIYNKEIIFKVGMNIMDGQ